MKYFLRSFLAIFIISVPAMHVTAQHDAVSVAHTLLREQAPKLGLSENDISGAIVTDNYSSPHNRVNHIYFQQHYQGIGIEKAVANINLSETLDLLSLHSRFYSDLQNRINTTTPVAVPAEALETVITHLGLGHMEVPGILDQKNDETHFTLFDKGEFSRSEIPVSLVYEPLYGDELRLAWKVAIYTKDAQHFWVTMIDAVNGKLLSSTDHVIHCGHGSDDHPETQIGKSADKFYSKTKEATQSESNFFDYLVFPLPVESPNHGEREIAADPAHPVASPFGWHDVNGVFGGEYSATRGNNVWAREDAAGDNEETIGYSPDPGLIAEYIYPLDLAGEPETYLDASITNLFYWNNIIHDIWYQYGFNEAAGNFQMNNYGRGGIGEDFVIADAQEGGFGNNANFFTPPEPDSMNRNPRMQMALWTGPGPGSNLFQVTSPVLLEGSYSAAKAQFGPSLPPADSPITGELAVVDDGTAQPAAGCNPIINGTDISGKIAVVDILGCSFVEKVQNAQDAGAIAVVVCLTFPGQPIIMVGESNSITIPSIMISHELCTSIKANLPGVTGSISLDPAGGPNQLDSDFDNGVIVHEYGHGISIRLTGGPALTNCLHNQEQAGEGWSDWLALMMTMEEGDLGSDARGIGTYVSNQPVRGGGIRPYPYSTDMYVNPHTYRNINTEFYPHGSGSVMAAMLWDMTWALIDEYGFDPDLYHGNSGNNMAFQLVIDGMKLQPCEPGFVDVRDAILLADSINYNGANQCLIWNTFARRGLGFSADQGNTDNRSDWTEGFDIPSFCIDELIVSKEVSSPSAIAGDTITFTITVFNGTDQLLTNNFITDTLPQGVDYVIGSVDCGASFSAGVLSIPLGTLAPDESMACSFEVIIQENFTTNYLFFDNMENGSASWVVSHGFGNADWELRESTAFSPTHAWYVNDLPFKTEQYLTLANPVPLSGSDLRLRFAHRFRTEAFYDGGVVEISANGGPWVDLGPQFLRNGYAGLLNPENPMGERNAFWGSSDGYLVSVADLDPWSGQDVLIRFRFATDEILGDTGWYLDNVSIANEKTIPNTACLTNDQGFDACGSVEEPTIILDPLVVSTIETELPYDIFVYPNPGGGEFKVALNGEMAGEVNLSVINLAGVRITNRKLRFADLKAHYLLDLYGLSPGMYLLKIESRESAVIKKIIIQ